GKARNGEDDRLRHRQDQRRRRRAGADRAHEVRLPSGTPHYMSPEQIREPKDAGAKSDVYSAGVVLYEMLTGTLPFNSRSLPKLIDAIYRGEKQAPTALRAEIDKELEAIVLKAMHPKMEGRYEGAREFFEALEEYNLRPMNTPTMRPQPAVGA